jgi:hypothetical protein
MSHPAFSPTHLRSTSFCKVAEPQPLTWGRVGIEQRGFHLARIPINLYNSGVPYARFGLYSYASDMVRHIQPIHNWMSRIPIYKNHASPAGSFAANRFPASQSASSGVSPSSTVIGKWLEHKMWAVMYSHLENECWLH